MKWFVIVVESSNSHFDLGWSLSDELAREKTIQLSDGWFVEVSLQFQRRAAAVLSYYYSSSFPTREAIETRKRVKTMAADLSHVQTLASKNQHRLLECTHEKVIARRWRFSAVQSRRESYDDEMSSQCDGNPVADCKCSMLLLYTGSQRDQGDVECWVRPSVLLDAVRVLWNKGKKNSDGLGSLLFTRARSLYRQTDC